MLEKKKKVEELKTEFISKMKICLLDSTKVSLIKLLIEYRCDKFSISNSEQYLGLKEMFQWVQNNFSEDRINASWIYIRGLKKSTRIKNK